MPRSHDVLEFGPFQLQADGRLLRHGAPVALSPKERGVLRVLAEAGGALVEKGAIVRKVWDGEPVGDESLTRSVHHLRLRLGKRPDGGEYIETTYGSGYRLAVPVARSERDRLLVLPPRDQAEWPCPDRVRDALLGEVVEELRITGHDVVSVIAAGTSEHYADDGRDAAVLAREVGADLVATLQITTRAAGSELDVCLRRVTDGKPLAQSSIPWPAGGLTAVVEHAAAAMLRAVRHHGGSGMPRRLARAMRTTPRVYEAYLEARSLFRKRGAERMQQAARLYQTALDWDPQYTPALVGLAECHLNLAGWGLLELGRARSVAEPLLARAEAIDPTTHGLLTLRAAVLSAAEWRFEEAEGLFRRALEEDGADTNGYLFYGRHLLNAGCPEAAVQALQACVELDPLAPAPYALHAFALWILGRGGEALSVLRRSIEVDPDSAMPLAVLAIIASHAGSLDEGGRAAQRASELASAVPLVASACAYAWARAGQDQRARGVLEAARQRATPLVASVYAPAALLLGGVETAIWWLETAFETRCTWLPTMRIDPRLARLRDEPRARAIFERIPSLPDAFDTE